MAPLAFPVDQGLVAHVAQGLPRFAVIYPTTPKTRQTFCATKISTEHRDLACSHTQAYSCGVDMYRLYGCMDHHPANMKVEWDSCPSQTLRNNGTKSQNIQKKIYGLCIPMFEFFETSTLDGGRTLTPTAQGCYKVRVQSGRHQPALKYAEANCNWENGEAGGLDPAPGSPEIA
ncbi:hypothetical protein M427DRAFT_45869 [Gonapodya prolifera JEL478]|uniref:Uncharacterized protein n=1 Tax=Gonapodya prolifera (strain JEL478) TaxID=1344416 RepID=A0A139A943_GONPJ|nr:hypothetical protein M427DRAFT_45869 [Gonapodya prolifera JEL478]|eukprot:KXS13320.1 hypothetical protein M427DRAFT_45869 [Gonapodya prolifera JEL478]